MKAVLPAQLLRSLPSAACQIFLAVIVEELVSIIGEWAQANRIEQFFADAERRAEKLDEGEMLTLLDRLRRARELVGSADALEHFLKWKSPEER